MQLGGIALGGRCAQRGQGLPGGAIADNDDAPALAVAATRRKARVVQDGVEDGVR